MRNCSFPRSGPSELPILGLTSHNIPAIVSCLTGTMPQVSGSARHGPPVRDHYQLVYDGEVETNDLEELYTKFNLNHPPGYAGHSLSMSDVLELYDEVDRFGF